MIVGAADVRRAELFCWDVLSANGGLSATWPDSWLSQHSTQHTEVSRRVKKACTGNSQTEHTGDADMDCSDEEENGIVI